MLDHKPTDHAPILFRWRTDLKAHGLPDNPDMRKVGHLVRAAQENCIPCMEHWATMVAEDENNRVAAVHLLCSSYTAATEICGWTHQELTENDVFGPPSEKILSPMREGDIRTMVITAKGMHPKEIWETLDDALAAGKLPKKVQEEK